MAETMNRCYLTQTGVDMSETEERYVTQSETIKQLEERVKSLTEANETLFGLIRQLIIAENEVLAVNDNLHAQNKELKNLLDYVIKNS
jgi:septal ring factor EnvC (AmiA/AmiB activator)